MVLMAKYRCARPTIEKEWAIRCQFLQFSTQRREEVDLRVWVKQGSDWWWLCFCSLKCRSERGPFRMANSFVLAAVISEIVFSGGQKRPAYLYPSVSNLRLGFWAELGLTPEFHPSDFPN